MNAYAAFLILAWIAIILLAFAMSGLMRQLHDMTRHQNSRGLSLGLAPGTLATYLPDKQHFSQARRLMIFADTDCESCQSIVPLFDDLVDSLPEEHEGIVITRNSAKGFSSLRKTRVVADPVAFDYFNIPFVPVAVAMRDGEILTTQAVGSEELLRAFFEQPRSAERKVAAK